MKTVLVNWTTEDRVMPNADKADHFVVGLGTTEVNVPLTERSHAFADVAPGTYTGWVTLVMADGTELAPPMTFNAVVPADPTAPAVVSVTATVQ